MAKLKTKFICQNCGYESPTWMGKCPDCGHWSSFIEEADTPSVSAIKAGSKQSAVALPLEEVTGHDQDRISTGIKELDRVLGGGIFPGSLVLIGGEPGIGKSTLLLQAAGFLSQKNKVLYLTAEESPAQVKSRAERLKTPAGQLYLLSENNLEAGIEAIENLSPSFVIVDSIQALFDPRFSSASGSVSQVRECTAQMMKLAKSKNITFFIIGHVTKEGQLAGPRVLEHMVDTVLYFEGERYQTFRALRVVKNRFGATNLMGLMEMTEDGLSEIQNPSSLFISQGARSSGSCITATVEGNRPLLIEVQALVTPSTWGTPRRSVTGFEPNRLLQILAVLEKRMGFPFSKEDVYVNITGGLKLSDPAVDLGVALALISNLKDQPLREKLVVMGEVGLGGELRPVANLEPRLVEAHGMGFTAALIPEGNAEGLGFSSMKIISAERVSQTLQQVFGEAA